ncbi:MAG: sugar transferase [Ruminococcaceae bacterium]|nr:sugar transferase [Oscillospiraceae bacterium]
MTKLDFVIRLFKLFNVLLMTAAFGASWFLYYLDCMPGVKYYRLGHVAVLGLYIFFYISFIRIYNGFHISVSRISEMIYSQILAVLISDGIIYLVICMLCFGFPNILPGLAVIAVQIIISIIWSFVSHKVYFKFNTPRRTAVIYDAGDDMKMLISEYGLEKKFDVQLVLKDDECIDNLDVLIGIQTVFITGIRSSKRNVILKYCIDNGIQVYLKPRVGDAILYGAYQTQLFHRAVLRADRHSPSPEYVFCKRFMDIVLSLVVLIIISPIMLLTALSIKLCDGGPVFYKQCRLTKDGKKFNVLKFRSMRVDAEKDGVARLSTGDKDDRITPIGKIIRKCRIDEFPQLLNILSGSMSIVGPRPERPEIAAQYEEVLPEFRLRLQVKAGLTGYAQVYGKYNTTPYDKLQMDLMYIARASLLKDLELMFATIKILFVSESTEGVADGQITAGDIPTAEAEDSLKAIKEKQNI